MNQKPLKLISGSPADKESKRRLTLKVFFDLLRPHREAIKLAQEGLKELTYPFVSGDRVMPDECEEAIDYLIDVSAIYRQFQIIIKQSDTLPLAVVPIRLTLLTILLDANAQIVKLKELLVVLSEASSTSLFQSPKHLYEIECELNALQEQNDQILDQVRVFTDNARFKEREYSMA
jgi:hypothetical protein